MSVHLPTLDVMSERPEDVGNGIHAAADMIRAVGVGQNGVAYHRPDGMHAEALRWACLALVKQISLLANVMFNENEEAVEDVMTKMADQLEGASVEHAAGLILEREASKIEREGE